MITHFLRQLEVLTQQRADGSRRVRVLEHAVNEPVCSAQLERLILWMFCNEIHSALIDLVFYHSFQNM